jgi:hypothetical protein
MVRNTNDCPLFAMGETMMEPSMRGKRVQFDDETFNALDLLGRDRMMDFQELADEAFSDLLKKHGRPTTLKSALRQSVGNERSVRDRANKTRSRNKRAVS